MKDAPKRAKEEGQKVPMWIVSFTDMITLLLAFFVLLQAFAKDRDPELFFIGQGSFRRAIAGLGIPGWLFGKREKAESLYRKKKYPTEPDESKLNRERVLDADDEEIRKSFANLKQALDLQSSDMAEATISVVPTPIRFGRGSAELDASGGAFVKTLAVSLSQSLRSGGIKVYVIGLAADETGRKQRWLLSADRARAVEEALRGALAEKLKSSRWEIDSWGAGAGGRWSAGLGLVPERSYIVIAVMGPGNQNG